MVNHGDLIHLLEEPYENEKLLSCECPQWYYIQKTLGPGSQFDMYQSNHQAVIQPIYWQQNISVAYNRPFPPTKHSCWQDVSVAYDQRSQRIYLRVFEYDSGYFLYYYLWFGPKRLQWVVKEETQPPTNLVFDNDDVLVYFPHPALNASALFFPHSSNPHLPTFRKSSFASSPHSFYFDSFPRILSFHVLLACACRFQMDAYGAFKPLNEKLVVCDAPEWRLVRAGTGCDPWFVRILASDGYENRCVCSFLLEIHHSISVIDGHLFRKIGLDIDKLVWTEQRVSFVRVEDPVLLHDTAVAWYGYGCHLEYDQFYCHFHLRNPHNGRYHHTDQLSISHPFPHRFRPKLHSFLSPILPSLPKELVNICIEYIL